MYGEPTVERRPLRFRRERRGTDYLPAEQSFLDPVRADAAAPASAQCRDRAVWRLEASVSYGAGTAAWTRRHPSAAANSSSSTTGSRDGRHLSRLRGSGRARTADRPADREPFARSARAPCRGRARGRQAPSSCWAGSIRPWRAPYPPLAGCYGIVTLVVVQFDAHADSRDGYLGARHSHAAAMRRVLDHAGVRPLIQLLASAPSLAGRGGVSGRAPGSGQRLLGQRPGELGSGGHAAAAQGSSRLYHLRYRPPWMRP